LDPQAENKITVKYLFKFFLGTTDLDWTTCSALITVKINFNNLIILLIHLAEWQAVVNTVMNLQVP
jgi:hypothetical protein